MDVAPGATDVPFRYLIAAAAVLLSFSDVRAAEPRPEPAAAGARPLHSSADRELWDRKSNRIELIGHAVVRQPGETLMADSISLDLNSRVLDARGNCSYVSAESIIYGEEMHFNLDTRTGTIVAGRVANDRFTLSGERINKLGEGRFQTHWGEYTTCRDCPGSWAFQAEDVDMQFEGYAFMSNVTARIKDSPAFWLPYLIVPMKTRRQTGLLFPRFGASNESGFIFVQPFFWAVNRSADMTIGLGTYSAKGTRAEWEGRYAFTDRSRGQANFYFLDDSSYVPEDPTVRVAQPLSKRWGLNITQTQELPGDIEEKLKITEVSDNDYPVRIGDVPWNREPTLASDLIFNYGGSQVSGYLAARRLRNVLTPNRIGFDPNTVQVFPRAQLTTNERFVAGLPVAAGITIGATNFVRPAGIFDYDPSRAGSGGAYLPGWDPVREATRVSVVPSLYTTLRPFDRFEVVPSLQYRAYYYNFRQALPNYYRGYLLFQADLSTEFERIYETGNPQAPRSRHLIRPLLTYSYVPYLREEVDHPFQRQIERASGYKFDNDDIVATENNPSNPDFIPIGNSLSYGFTTQLIRRIGAVDDPKPTYRTPVSLSAGQAINFREFRKPVSERIPLSRLFVNLDARLAALESSTTYYHYTFGTPFKDQVSTSVGYVFVRGRRGFALFERSVALSYSSLTPFGAEARSSSLAGTVNFSLSDYLLPSLSSSYDFARREFGGAAFGVALVSPSQCWRVSLNVGYTPSATTWVPDLTLNLTGSGFMGLGEFTSLGGQAQ